MSHTRSVSAALLLGIGLVMLVCSVVIWTVSVGFALLAGIVGVGCGVVAGVLLLQSGPPKSTQVPESAYIAQAAGLHPSNAVAAAVLAVVRRHISVLADERRNRIVVDKYGMVHSDAWIRELSAFAINAAWPQVAGIVGYRNMIASIDQALLKKRMDTSEQSRQAIWVWMISIATDAECLRYATASRLPRAEVPSARVSQSFSINGIPVQLPADAETHTGRTLPLPDPSWQTAYHEVMAVVDELVLKHKSVLVAKRRQKSHRDDYGVLIDSNWQSELKYFVDAVVDKEIQNRCTNAIIECAQRHVVAEMDDDFSDRLDDKELYWFPIIVKYIDNAVTTMDAGEPQLAPDDAEMSPADYERHCAESLTAAGWSVRVCGGTGDQGVDLVADRGEIRAVFQCKLYSTPVGNGAVQEVYTGKAFHDAKIAAVVTNAGFTPAARAAAERTGVRLLHHSQLHEFEAFGQ